MPADNGDGGGGGGDNGPPPWAGQHKNGSWPDTSSAGPPWFPNRQAFWSSSSSSFPAGVSPTPTPFGGGVGSAADKDAPSKLGHGGLMAAVIVPIVLVILSIVGLLFFLARRRRRRSGYAFNNNSSEPKPSLSSLEMANASSSSHIINETREYRRPPSPPPQLPPPSTVPNNLHAPIIISTSRNNAYLTGLDTGSEGSQSRPVSGDFDDNLIRRSFGGTFAEPPPPYVPKGQGDDAPPRDEYVVSPIEGIAVFGGERVASPFGDEHAFMDEEDMGMADGMQYHRDPFGDPESPVSEMGGEIREGVRPSGMREL